MGTALVGVAGVLSLAMIVGSIAAVAVFVTRIPVDYFSQAEPPPSPWAHRHPAIAVTLRVLKNLLGVALIVAGIGMLVLPGQGLLTILLGLMLVEFPGKRRVELAMVGRRQVGDGLNWIRSKSGKPPLDLPGQRG